MPYPIRNTPDLSNGAYRADFSRKWHREHTELSELKAELPDKWEYYIDRLSGYIASTGRKYKNHAATIRRWAADDTAKAAPKKGIPDYSYKEGESL